MKNVHKINIMNKEDFVSVEAIPVDDYNQQHCYNYQQPGENNQHYNAPIQAQVIGGQQHPNPYNPNFGLQQQYPPRRGIDIEATKQLLTGQKWPLGLQLALIDGMKKCPKRYFIVDDSGSMGCNDGNMCIEQGNIIKSVQCSRWTELTSSLKFHALLAHTAKNPSEFRLLNGAQPIVIGENDDPDKILYSSLMAIFNESPGGGTPLCRHINEVTASIQRDEAELRSNNQKAVVIICTDGLSSDGDIITAMKPLTRLPVFVVIRLCTDDNAVVDYWSNVDSQLELELDVLDDFVGESKEVFTANPWLNYGLPLHRLREFGTPKKEFDVLDEEKLSTDHMRSVCSMLFNIPFEMIPHPDLDYKIFNESINKYNNMIPGTWDPNSRMVKKWIDQNKLNKLYNKTASGCNIM